MVLVVGCAVHAGREHQDSENRIADHSWQEG